MRGAARTSRRGLGILLAAGCGLALAGCAPSPSATWQPAALPSEPVASPAGTLGPPGALVWSDEFTGPAGSGPDPAKWGHDLGGEWNEQELQYYTNRLDNVALNGAGQLVITARRDAVPGQDCRSGPCEYTSGRLSTAGRFTQRYGTFEARIKLPVSPGMLPAFWMIGENIHSVGWPACGEIDVVEHPGLAADTIHGSVHGPNHSKGAPFRLPDGRSFGDDYHTFTVRWSPTAINFFVDGVWYAQQTPETTGQAGWVYNQPFFIVLNLAVGGKWAGRPDGRTQFPQEMIVDYVRVFSWDEAAG